jgi:hypothetical protein
MLPPPLSRELAALQERFQVEIVEEPDAINLVFAEFPTSPLYSHPTTELLLRVPRAYPDAGLDMFWTSPQLTLATGGIPQSGESVETYAGRQWRRFSWHHNGWRSQLQSIEAYLDFVKRRFDAA